MVNNIKDNSKNNDFPAPSEGFVLTHIIIIKNRAISCKWYQTLLNGKVVMDLSESSGPCIIKASNSWIILNVGGGEPTVDKPHTNVKVKEDHDVLSVFLNIRVANIQDFYNSRKALGAEFISEPKEFDQKYTEYKKKVPMLI